MDWPTAFYLSSLEDVVKNPHVLFRLVTPTPPNRLQKQGGVQSAAGLVNVIPQKRIYIMETKDEIEVFKQELLKRPLVIQCSCHSGLGFGSAACGCGSFSGEKNFILLINQTHPKVLGRLQMGVDAAKHAMKSGMPFVLRYQFGSLLERLHTRIFDRSSSKVFSYTEWESAELVVRYPGRHSCSSINPASTFRAPPCRELNFDFADIQLCEIQAIHSDTSLAVKGPIPAITADEIRDELPGWTVNEITPLEEFGEERPDTYSYAQAGRLYESFRKKKRQRKIKQDEEDHTETSFTNNGRFGSREQQSVPPFTEEPHRPQRRKDKYSQDDGYVETNLYPAVKVVDTPRVRTSSNDTGNYYLQATPGAGTATPFDQIHHRDSDRSTYSTGESSGAGADSGYSGDDGYSGYHGIAKRGDIRAERDYGRKGGGGGGRDYDYVEDKYGSTTAQIAHDNYAFRHEETDRQEAAMRQHKEYVSRMLQKQEVDGISPGHDYREESGRSQSRHSSSDHHQGAGRRHINDRSRSRGCSDPEEVLPSYGDITRGEGALRITAQELDAESFI